MKNKIKFIEDYLQWVNDNKLDPPTFSPEEYHVHLNNIKNQELIDEIILLIESSADAKKTIDSIILILKNNVKD